MKGKFPAAWPASDQANFIRDLQDDSFTGFITEPSQESSVEAPTIVVVSVIVPFLHCRI